MSSVCGSYRMQLLCYGMSCVISSRLASRIVGGGGGSYCGKC